MIDVEEEKENVNLDNKVAVFEEQPTINTIFIALGNTLNSSTDSQIEKSLRIRKIS